MKTVDKVYWLHSLSSLHLGAGRGEGHIDLPLAREKITNFPYVPGSSFKGVFADACGATEERRTPPKPDKEEKSSDSKYNPVLHAAFGIAGDDTSNAGALVFTDARLICLPVRSLFGTFAWCTSPEILRRLTRDLQAAGFDGLPEIPKHTDCGSIVVPSDSEHQSVLVSGQEPKVYLEDLDLVPGKCDHMSQWSQRLADEIFSSDDEKKVFRERFALLADDVFNFLCETGTEVQPHIKIEAEFKRVASGALWYEESLPAETILAGLVWCDRIYGVKRETTNGTKPIREQEVLGLCQDHPAMQIGGKASVGKGRVRCAFSNTDQSKQQWGTDG